MNFLTVPRVLDSDSLVRTGHDFPPPAASPATACLFAGRPTLRFPTHDNKPLGPRQRGRRPPQRFVDAPSHVRGRSLPAILAANSDGSTPMAYGSIRSTAPPRDRSATWNAAREVEHQTECAQRAADRRLLPKREKSTHHHRATLTPTTQSPSSPTALATPPTGQGSPSRRRGQHVAPNHAQQPAAASAADRALESGSGLAVRRGS
jgi:hypothetical protein